MIIEFPYDNYNETTLLWVFIINNRSCKKYAKNGITNWLDHAANKYEYLSACKWQLKHYIQKLLARIVDRWYARMMTKCSLVNFYQT